MLLKQRVSKQLRLHTRQHNTPAQLSGKASKQLLT
jgi:hypothetical protein